MQWLIDLIIEAIGVPPCYIDRGDPVNADFATEDFTLDDAWHELDLSSLIPAGATAVALTGLFINEQVQRLAMFRLHGNSNAANVARIYTQSASLTICSDFVVALDPDRKIDYLFEGFFWSTISLTVKGWWL